MVLQSSKKCKNYKQQLSHSPEKYQEYRNNSVTLGCIKY